MSAEKYPVLETGRDEENLFFSTSTEDQACIGHLRGDFGSGTEFWTTWWDHHEELKDQPFKNELDAMVNVLRKDGPLKDLSSMESFCQEHPQARMSQESGSDYYGFRVDTAKHRFYMRFLPRRGDYNFYIYCYQTDKLERTAPQTREGNAEKPTPQYDLSSAIGISVSAGLARERAAREPDQNSYNAAWLHGYAKALADVAEQLERQQPHKRGPEKAADQKKKRGTTHER